MSSMGLEMSMKQKLSTELRMAPHIIQSIEVLTLPILELQAFVQEQLEINPVLETLENSEDMEESHPSLSSEEKQEEASEKDELKPVDEARLNSFENLELEGWDEFYSQDRIAKRGDDDDKDKKLEAMQNSADRPCSLQDHLFEQFRFSDLPEHLWPIGEQIIYNIDANGYLRYPLEEIVRGITPNPSIEHAQEALRYVQKLDPSGIGARNIQECLILQLLPQDPDYQFKKDLIEKYLQDISDNKYPKIAKELGRDIEEIKFAVEEIKHLNPKPGAKYGAEQSHIILPDVVIELVDGEYVIRMEDEYIPQLRINPYYMRLLQEEKADTELNSQAKDFIKKKIESANWVIDAIRQRQNTLYRVVAELVKNQRLFLDHGLNALKPLKMQEVADALQIHVSTVSRAISEKYIQTPRGIFPIKFFFIGSIDKKGGENESRVSVKQRVQEMINQEDKISPLSDEEIVERLKQSGLEIARRTVTKYRKALGIASSRRRKQY